MNINKSKVFLSRYDITKYLPYRLLHQPILETNTYIPYLKYRLFCMDNLIQEINNQNIEVDKYTHNDIIADHESLKNELESFNRYTKNNIQHRFSPRHPIYCYRFPILPVIPEKFNFNKY